MKKFLLFAFMLFPLFAMAQYFNAYEYGAGVVDKIRQQQEAQQRSAYDYGASVVNRIQAEQEAMIRKNPTLMRGHLISAIASGNDDKAFEYADYLAANYSTPTDWYWLGVLYEAGIKHHNLESAKRCYRNGASMANGEGCQNRLNEIAAGRTIDTNTVRQYCRQVVAASQAAAPIYNPGADLSAPASSGKSKSSGPCSRCHGTRIDPVRIDYSPGSSTMSNKIPAYTRCPYCGDTKTIDHWHKSCLDCAYH